MEQSLSQKALKNSAWNTAAFFAGIFFSIAVTPFVVHRLGVSGYGLIILINTIISILSLFELGMGSSLVKVVSQDVGQGNLDVVEEHVGAMVFLSLIISIIGSIVFLCLAWFGFSLLKIPVEMAGTYRILFYIGAGNFFVSSLSTPFNSVLPALQRYDILSKISVVNGVLLNCATLILVALGFRVQAVLFVQFLSSLILLIVYIIFTKRLLPTVNIRISTSIKVLSPVANFGFFVFLKNISTQALAHFDKIIVTSVLGPAAVSFYSVPGSIPLKTVGIIQSITDIFFPFTSNLSAQNDKEKVRAIYPRVMRNVILLAAACTFSIIIFGKKILFFLAWA